MMEKSVAKLLKTANTLQHQIEEQKAEYESVLLQLQTSCDHPRIAELPSQSSMFFAPIPPGRICAVCALEEWADSAGWWSSDFAGWWVMQRSDRTVTNEHFYKHRRGERAVVKRCHKCKPSHPYIATGPGGFMDHHHELVPYRSGTLDELWGE